MFINAMLSIYFFMQSDTSFIHRVLDFDSNGAQMYP